MKTKKYIERIVVLMILLVFGLVTKIPAGEGKIKFSESFKTFSEKAKDTFQVGDELYLKVKLNKPLHETYNQYDYTYNFGNTSFTYNYGIRIYVDGDLDGQFLLEMPQSDFRSKTVIKHALASEKEEITREHYPLIMQWMDLLKEYDEGMHQIKMKLVPIYPDIAKDELPVLATGQIHFRLDKDDLMTYEDRKTSDLPPSTMESEQIEDRIVDASADLYTGATPIEAVITDMEGDWTYFTDNNGNITHRNIIASVVYYWTSQDKCTLKTARFYQKHKGYGTFGPLLFFKEVEGYYDYEVPCDEVTKANLEEPY